MPGDRSRVIARVFSTHTSEYASLRWEWVIRADGQVQYRLSRVGGRPERNPWMRATQLSSTGLRQVDAQGAEAWLAGLARQRGHHVDGS